MEEHFRFELSGQEKEYLKQVAKKAVADRLDGRPDAKPPQPPSPRLLERFGAFVTLTRHGELRGCIGNLVGNAPLAQTIANMARAAAFEDPRFAPLSPAEFADIDVDISILGPITPCPDPGLVVVGRHGLIVKRGHMQGLLLPQVAVEWGWDRETFLAHTCQKAGLPVNAWRDPQTEIFWFEAEVF